VHLVDALLLVVGGRVAAGPAAAHGLSATAVYCGGALDLGTARDAALEPPPAVVAIVLFHHLVDHGADEVTAQIAAAVDVREAGADGLLGLLGDLLLVGLGRGVVAFLGRDGGERGAHREQRQQGEGQAEAPGPACIVCVFHGVPQLIYRTSAEALSVV